MAQITNISIQAKNKDRVNVSVDGSYRFSLDIAQVTELGIKIGNEYSETELDELLEESDFGKLYARALEYTMMRPHSSKEIRDYIWRKTRPARTPSGQERLGYSVSVAGRVIERLEGRGYLDDDKFASYWVENRRLAKGVSRRRLELELRQKGVDPEAASKAMAETSRDESEELRKIILKKRQRYDDEQKLIAYLMRQGFPYDLIRQTISDELSAQAEESSETGS